MEELREWAGASLRDSVRDFFQAPSLCTAAALLMDAIDVAGIVGTTHSFSASASGSQSVDFDISTGQPRRTMDETVEGWMRQGDACYNSFSADTPVATPDGDVPINEIEVGDSVLAYNEQTRSIGAYPVTATISHVDFTVIDLTIASETLETTAEHPFYTPGGAWVDAGDLAVSDQVWSRAIGFAEVEAVEQRPALQPMFNLTVDEAHTFFVGDGDWLVHNVCVLEHRVTFSGTDIFDVHINPEGVWLATYSIDNGYSNILIDVATPRSNFETQATGREVWQSIWQRVQNQVAGHRVFYDMDNLNRLNEMLSQGLSEQDAVWSSWSGRMVREFTDLNAYRILHAVRVPNSNPVIYSSIKIEFYRSS